jgi:hypothetical protein
MTRTLSISAAFLCFLCVSAVGASVQVPQTRPTPSLQQPDYPDTTMGLRHFLDDALAAARSSDPSQLDAMIAGTEIPDSTAWFVATFGQTDGTQRAADYQGTLPQREAEFRRRLLSLTQSDGQFSVEELVPTDLYTTLQAPLDVFLASWEPRDSAGLPRRPTPIAYFFFVAGKFRLDVIASANAH